MGGGRGALGSGIAGGYEGNQSQNQNQGQNQSQNSNQSQSATGTGTGQTAEKQDWLDKSLETAGKKFGVNISDANADKIGDFVNKEFQSKAGESRLLRAYMRT
ncbi:hypothetical protein BD309DRAFT_870347 [Dichomitus squalens]|nr:hypothetical protein BD309DRAFT_870347 [Dichomitus squalens]